MGLCPLKAGMMEGSLPESGSTQRRPVLGKIGKITSQLQY